MKTTFYALLMTLSLLGSCFAASNLRINNHLDYSSDSLDGPLITGDDMSAGAKAGVPNYIIIYGEGCYNSKHQAQRTVELYERYKGRVNFVVVDLDLKRSDAQQALVKTYYRGSIPHVVVLDKSGKALYNSAGEVPSERIAEWLDKALQ